MPASAFGSRPRGSVPARLLEPAAGTRARPGGGDRGGARLVRDRVRARHGDRLEAEPGVWPFIVVTVVPAAPLLRAAGHRVHEGGALGRLPDRARHGTRARPARGRRRARRRGVGRAGGRRLPGRSRSDARSRPRAATPIWSAPASALAIACDIAAYTLVDKHGIEHAGPITYLELGMVPAALGYAGVVLVASAGTAPLRAELRLASDRGGDRLVRRLRARARGARARIGGVGRSRARDERRDRDRCSPRRSLRERVGRRGSPARRRRRGCRPRQPWAEIRKTGSPDWIRLDSDRERSRRGDSRGAADIRPPRRQGEGDRDRPLHGRPHPDRAAAREVPLRGSHARARSRGSTPRRRARCPACSRSSRTRTCPTSSTAAWSRTGGCSRRRRCASRATSSPASRRRPPRSPSAPPR